MNYYYPKGYPKKGMDLNKPPEKNDIAIVLETTGRKDEEFFKYSAHYRSSAHKLAAEVLRSGNNSQRDKYILPIGFLYRNSLELIIKAISSKYLSNSYEHNIIDILVDIQIHITEIINLNKKSFMWLVAFLEDLDKFDKKSDLFRYPFKIVNSKDNTGKKRYRQISLLPGRIEVDFYLFANKFEIAYAILNSYYKEECFLDDIKPIYQPVLFQKGHYLRTSIIGESWFENRYQPFIEGYIFCATHLWKYILNESENKNVFFNSMCYLYRNTIELFLKKIIYESDKEELQQKLDMLNSKNKHSIQKLWNKINTNIYEFVTTPDRENSISLMNSMIEKMQSDDPKSDKYRYPMNRDGEFFWKKTTTKSINNVIEYYEAIYNFLDSVDTNIEELNVIE